MEGRDGDADVEPATRRLLDDPTPKIGEQGLCLGGTPGADQARHPAKCDVYSLAVRTRLGQYAGAQADYGRALELTPDADIFTARGWTFLLTDTPKLAIDDFANALKLENLLARQAAGETTIDEARAA